MGRLLRSHGSLHLSEMSYHVDFGCVLMYLLCEGTGELEVSWVSAAACLGGQSWQSCENS